MPRAVRDVLPFVVVAVVGILTLVAPPERSSIEPWVVAGGCLAAFATIGVLMARVRSRALTWAAPLLFFVVIAVARDASGGGSSGLTPLLLLPVLWIVLHGSRSQLRVAALATGGVLWVPLLVFGDPKYDVSDWRRGLLWSLSVLLVCPAVQSSVQALRSERAGFRRISGELGAVLDATKEYAVIACDGDGVITLFSRGAQRMLGYTPAEVVGAMSAVAFHDPTEIDALAGRTVLDPTEALSLVLDLATVSPSASTPWTFVRADGSTFRVMLTVSALSGDVAEGMSQGWVFVARDVTAEESAARQVKDAEERWRLLLDHLPDTAVLVVDPDMRYQVAVGPGLANQGLADIQGKTLYETSGTRNVPPLERTYREALAGREAMTEIVSTNAERVNEVVAAPLPPHHGVPRALVVARDVSGARARERELARTRDLFERLFTEAPHGTVLLDDRGVVVNANPALCAMLRAEPEDVVGRSVLSMAVVHGRDPAPLRALLEGRLRRVELAVDLRVGTPDELNTRVTAVALGPEGAVDQVLLTVVDESETRRHEQQLAHLADHDPLTGLANRRRFDAALTAHLERCRRYGWTGALLMLDLDDFKQVNDALGHAAGDQLIVATAAFLTHRLRDSDLVARLGGDEFAILLPEADRRAAEIVAADVVSTIADNVAVMDGGQRRRVTASVGVVLLHDAELGAEQLLSAADLTMYDAKRAGRDRFVVHDSTAYAS